MSTFPLIAGMPFELAASSDLLSGIISISGFGNNPNVGSGSVTESAWSQGGMYPWMPNPPPALQIRSTSAQDSISGTGASRVLLQALGTDLIEANATVTLTGTTPVPLPAGVYRLNFGVTIAKGSAATTGLNVGDIIVEDVAGPNTVRMLIPAGSGNSKQAAYTVPFNHILLLTNFFFGLSTFQGATTKLGKMGFWSRLPGGPVHIPIEIPNSTEGPVIIYSSPAFRLESGVDLDLIVTNGSTSDEDVTAAWNGYLVDLP